MADKPDVIVNMALGERLLEVFADAGLTPDDTARAGHLFTTYVLGSIALEAAELDHSAPPPPEDERVATRHVRFAAVPADRYPCTAATATTMARYITTAQFIWGLNRYLLVPAGPAQLAHRGPKRSVGSKPDSRRLARRRRPRPWITRSRTSTKPMREPRRSVRG